MAFFIVVLILRSDTGGVIVVAPGRFNRTNRGRTKLAMTKSPVRPGRANRPWALEAAPKIDFGQDQVRNPAEERDGPVAVHERDPDEREERQVVSMPLRSLG
ncbi:MAG TPA: hypothetical protein VFC47_13860 [Caulobacteraceae bacterium]|nr:hypothetical protein [Caulobacteraceae bacterium]